MLHLCLGRSPDNRIAKNQGEDRTRSEKKMTIERRVERKGREMRVRKQTAWGGKGSRSMLSLHLGLSGLRKELCLQFQA